MAKETVPTVKRGLSGIGDEEKKQIQQRVDEITALSKAIFAITDFEKFGIKLEKLSEAIMPYLFSINVMLDSTRGRVPDDIEYQAEVNKIIDAFDGAYLWSRVKPSFKEFDNNKLKTTHLEKKTQTEDIIIDLIDGAMIEMLDDTTLFHIQKSLVLLKKPVKRRSEKPAETRDGFFTLLDKTNNSLAQALDKNPQAKETLNSNYALMRQGIAVNTLTKIKSSKKNMRVDEITGKVTIQRGDFKISFETWPEITGLRTSTHQLFNALMIEFTETGAKSTRITLPLKKYMELRGLTNELSARRQVEADLETLYRISISFKEKLKGKKPRDYSDMRLVIDKGIKKGVIYCTFHPDFYGLMIGYRVMPMAKKALAIDDRYNKSSYYFLTRLSEHVNMNCFKSNRDIISVQTLLDATPEIPTYDEVAEGDRHYARHIIDPFERDMDALEKIGAIKWEYCHSNGLALTDDELEMSYDTFIKLLIKFELIGYPERELKQLSKPKNRPKKRKK